MAAAPLFAQEIIRRKRDGMELAAPEIESLVRGLVDGSLSEGQAAAFAMAVFFRGLSMAERTTLTLAMARSGRVLDWRGASLPGPTLDKHSTGGVGDKVSLMLAPIVAACGGAVPMISGRGLGHTGGTLDKLASIPGYQTAPDLDTFRRVVAGAGCAIIGQTDDLAPADRRLYAIRDVTATVESIPLLTSSILSKKIAAGLTGLVMDIKFGSGAFIPAYDGALELANSIVGVAGRAGLPTTALLTDMNQVLGRTAGNAVEVREAIAYLRGDDREARLDEVTRTLSAELLVLGRLARDSGEAAAKVERALESGAAAEHFQRMVAALGGPSDIIERPERHLALAPIEYAVNPVSAGFVSAIDVRAMGIAVMILGGGRRQTDDAIDHSVGLLDVAPLGARVGDERPLAHLRARSDATAERAAQLVRSAMTISTTPPAGAPVIRNRIAAAP